MTLAAKAIALYREEGWPGLRRRVSRSVWNCQKYVVYRKDLVKVDRASHLNGVEFRLATDEDIPWICAQMDHLKEHADGIVRAQFLGSDLTVIGVTAGNPPELVFSVWLSREDFGLKLLGDLVGKHHLSVRRVWVRPTRRRSGLAAQGFISTEQLAMGVGISHLWSFVTEDNIASRGLHEKMGYEDVGRIRSIKRFRRRYVKCRTMGQRRWKVQALPEGMVRI